MSIWQYPHARAIVGSDVHDLIEGWFHVIRRARQLTPLAPAPAM